MKVDYPSSIQTQVHSEETVLSKVMIFHSRPDVWGSSIFELLCLPYALTDLKLQVFVFLYVLVQTIINENQTKTTINSRRVNFTGEPQMMLASSTLKNYNFNPNCFPGINLGLMGLSDVHFQEQLFLFFQARSVRCSAKA